jgi:hypothetical protein
MKEIKQQPPDDVPTVTKDQLAELRARLGVGRPEPVLPTGTVSVCPNCGGRMVTTNDLERTIASPGLVYVIARLPGARCETCESIELDASGVAMLQTIAPREMVADYETAVTHSSGTTLGTYFKMDLSRVLGLTGDERLFWKVVDRNNVLVQIRRTERSENSHRPTTARVGVGVANRSLASRRRARKHPAHS